MWFYVILFVLALLIMPVLVLNLITRRGPGANFSGKHVLIIGGSQGIGLELAKQCAALGSDITILARNMKQLEIAKSTVKACAKFPNSQRVEILSCDVTESYQTIEMVMRQVVNKLGEVDVLLNCAGFAKCKYFNDLTAEELKKLMDVNYFGSLYPTKALIEGMMRRKTGTIAFVSSQGGQVGFVGMSGYSPTKYAVRGLAECLRSELLPFNINVAVIYPPDTDTPGYAQETLDKVVECREISAQAGLLKPDYVAKEILTGLQRGDFSISIGVDGLMLDTVTSGLTVYPGFFKAFMQIYAIGVFRIVGMFYASVFQNIVLKHSNGRKLYKD